MSAAVSKSIVDLLIAGGVESREEAAQLAQNLNGGSLTTPRPRSWQVDGPPFLLSPWNFFPRSEVLNEGDTAAAITADDPEASVVNFVNQVIREAIAERATDIHVEPLENDIRIRYRIDGILHEVAVPPQLRVLHAAIISRLKVMSHMDIAERRLPQDGRMNLQASNQEIDVRVSTIPTVNGESISLRLLSRGGQQFGFDRLDMSKKQEKTIRHLLAQPNGIILLTGPTGCGKSTSLYCYLSTINSVSRRIITIEEPVEYKLPGVLQMDVKPEIDFTFARGLRHILRQDPNVVMVGEIRDIETADIAIRAAMTGHLVFSTLHTNDAVGGITRLLDMDVEPFLLSSVVKSFIAQRLVRTICPECAEKVDYPGEYLGEIGFPLKELGTKFMRGKGCDQCRQTGYQGRAAIYEICVVTEPLRKMIMQKRDGGELKQCAIAEGMETLRQDGWRRVAQGSTTLEEVVRVTQTDEVMAETTEEAEPVVAGGEGGRRCVLFPTRPTGKGRAKREEEQASGDVESEMERFDGVVIRRGSSACAVARQNKAKKNG